MPIVPGLVIFLSIRSLVLPGFGHGLGVVLGVQVFVQASLVERIIHFFLLIFFLVAHLETVKLFATQFQSSFPIHFLTESSLKSAQLGRNRLVSVPKKLKHGKRTFHLKDAKDTCGFWKTMEHWKTSIPMTSIPNVITKIKERWKMITRYLITLIQDLLITFNILTWL